MSITPSQCKAARELLGWRQSELAYVLGVSGGENPRINGAFPAEAV
jgi:hypothetical protein